MRIWIYVTDKTGRKGWKTECTLGFHQGEKTNIERRLEWVKQGLSKDFDAASARMVMEDAETGQAIDQTPIEDEKLLADLLDGGIAE